MPVFRQASDGMVRLGALTPVAGTRAGTVNDAGGLLTDVDCRDYKSIMVTVEAGVVPAAGTVDLQVNDAIAASGTYAAHTNSGGTLDGAITQITTGPNHAVLSLPIKAGRPYIQLVLVQVSATTISCAQIYGKGPTSTNRV